MDEDTKTLLAILALIYGSASGVGLFKTSLDPVKTKTDELSGWIRKKATASTVIREGVKSLLKKLWSLGVVVYVVMSILPAILLGFIVRYGTHEALQRIGLATATTTPVPWRPSPFYWILFTLSLVTAWQLLADYRQGWRTVFRGWWSARKQEQQER